MGEQLADEGAEVVADAAGKRAVADGLHQILEDLSEREQTIVEMRFGLGDYAGAGSRSAEDVAAALKISVARVHELELRALRKLRSKAKGAGLDKCVGWRRGRVRFRVRFGVRALARLEQYRSVSTQLCGGFHFQTG